MAKRKSLSDSIRWAVFARDGFCCRYCGKQAGEDGVTLAVDHIVSIADGGDNRLDNLATACKTCNGGKAAKSLMGIPTTEAIVARVEARAKTAEALAKQLKYTMDLNAWTDQQIVNIKCRAYGSESTIFDKAEKSIVRNLLTEFGPELVIEWYASAARNGCLEDKAVKYICGCARNEREDHHVDEIAASLTPEETADFYGKDSKRGV